MLLLVSAQPQNSMVCTAIVCTAIVCTATAQKCLGVRPKVQNSVNLTAPDPHCIICYALSCNFISQCALHLQYFSFNLCWQVSAQCTDVHFYISSELQSNPCVLHLVHLVHILQYTLCTKVSPCLLQCHLVDCSHCNHCSVTLCTVMSQCALQCHLVLYSVTLYTVMSHCALQCQLASCSVTLWTAVLPCALQSYYPACLPACCCWHYQQFRYDKFWGFRWMLH